MAEEPHTLVTATFIRSTPRAVRAQPQGRDAMWFPRRALVGMTRKQTDEMTPQTEYQFPLAQWFVQQENL